MHRSQELHHGAVSEVERPSQPGILRGNTAAVYRVKHVLEILGHGQKIRRNLRHDDGSDREFFHDLRHAADVVFVRVGSYDVIKLSYSLIFQIILDAFGMYLFAAVNKHRFITGNYQLAVALFDIYKMHCYLAVCDSDCVRLAVQPGHYIVGGRDKIKLEYYVVGVYNQRKQHENRENYKNDLSRGVFPHAFLSALFSCHSVSPSRGR